MSDIDKLERKQMLDDRGDLYSVVEFDVVREMFADLERQLANKQAEIDELENALKNQQRGEDSFVAKLDLNDIQTIGNALCAGRHEGLVLDSDVKVLIKKIDPDNKTNLIANSGISEES